MTMFKVENVFFHFINTSLSIPHFLPRYGNSTLIKFILFKTNIESDNKSQTLQVTSEKLIQRSRVVKSKVTVENINRV